MDYLFKTPPAEIIGADYFYDADADGDCFDDSDEHFWLEGNGFRNNWEGKRQGRDEIAVLCDEIAARIAGEGKPYMEIACGPGMGLTPIILAKNPRVPCLAQDACSRLIKAWRKYITAHLTEFNIYLASFSLLDMPIADNCLDYVTGFLAIGSTRNGAEGQTRALAEVYRVIKPGGCFVTVEGEFTDMNAVDEVFARWNRPNWFSGELWRTPWREKFLAAGFQIEDDSKSYYRKWDKDANEFGEAAQRYDIEVGMRYTLYVLRK